MVILCVACVNFALIRLAPGDPASIMAGQSGAADEQFVQQLRVEFDLDRPLAAQFQSYMSRLVRLDLGYSYRNQKSVSSLIAERLPATLLLTGSALIISLVLGIAAGAVAATFEGTAVDRVISGIALVSYATPSFWVGLISILVFSQYLGWFPPFGMTSAVSAVGTIPKIFDVIKHLFLPAMTLSLFYSALYMQMTRSSMITVSGEPYIKTARAKGLGRWRIARAHVLRNAILPVLTLAGIQAGYLLGGSILIETVFAWPGLGSLAYDALIYRDYNLILGIFLAISTVVVATNAVVEILYHRVDARIGSSS
jgi:peptide/nickel transport system permease protein